MNRSRDYYRFQRERVIKRKMSILAFQMGKDYSELFYKEHPVGKLAKGKVHCSCRMCRTKSSDEISHRDKVAQERAEDSIKGNVY